MTHAQKKLDNSQIELTITVPPAEYQKHLEKAALRISEQTAIKGFRPGHVPFDIIKKEVGEMNVLQEALESIVQETFFKTIMEEKLDTIGMPNIAMEKVAPCNDVVYKATVAIIPKVKLPDMEKIKVARKVTTVGEAEVRKTIDALRGLQATEVIKDGKADGTDKLVLDMNMLLDNVPVEGGQAKDYQVYLSEEHYIPGFNEQVRGLKKGDEKTFKLDFPKTHYQKMLAGKNVEFKVNIKDVFERKLPEFTDDFAKRLGKDTAEELKSMLQKNMVAEAELKADQKTEIEILDALIEKTEFAPIPRVLIDAERQKMFYELKRDLGRHDISIDQYLADLKKNEKELFEDFKEQAEKRAKAALVSRQVALEQKIEVAKEEIDAEIKVMEEVYKDDAEVKEKLSRPEVRDTIATTIQNRKVMGWLKSRIIK